MYQSHLVHRWKFVICAHLLCLCNVLTDVSSPCLPEGDSQTFSSVMMSLSEHRLPNLWEGFIPQAHKWTGWQGSTHSVWVTDLLCLPLEAEHVNIPPNKGNNRAHGQNLAIPSTGLRVWWPSRTNVIIIRTSQHYVAFPHPPYIHSIEWIFFFSFPHFFPSISLFLAHGVPEKTAFSRTLHARRFPLALCLVGFVRKLVSSDSWPSVCRAWFRC